MKFEPHESPYSFVAMVPQDVTERLLVEELRRKGGNVEYETKFISTEQDDYGVNATIEHRGESNNQTTCEQQSWLGAMGRTAPYCRANSHALFIGDQHKRSAREHILA